MVPRRPYSTILQGIRVPNKLHLDFETRASIDLKKVGAHVYAAHEDTELLCLGFAFDEEPVEIIPLGNFSNSATLYHIMDYVEKGGRVIAHNAAFELAIWNRCALRRYHNWVPLEVNQVDCTMVRAYTMGFPGDLEGAAIAAGLNHSKDMQGHRLMLKMSKPREKAPAPVTWHETEEQLERLYAYCKQDIVVERALDKRLLALQPQERELWILDQKINNRGIAVDLDAATKATEVVKYEADRLNAEMRDVTGNRVASATAVVQLKEWLLERGHETPGVAKDDVTVLLDKMDLQSDVRRALEVRREAAKSSTAKLASLINGASLDERLRGTLQFHAAGTGRWGGRRFQPHNLPRPTLKHHQVDEAIEYLWHHDAADCRDYFDMMFGPPMTVISDCLRGMLHSHTDNLAAVDFNAIEARVVAWLAGEEKVLQVFRTHGKIYEQQAGRIFGVDPATITKDDFRRLIGKVAILALGFQGGVFAFLQMAKNYNVKMAPALPSLWATADEARRERALERYSKDGKKSGIPKEEWLASELTKVAWREEHPNIVAYWNQIERAAILAVKTPGTIRPAPRVQWLKRGSFLFCKLPSGRNLCYPYPKIEEKATPWGQMKEMLTYMGEDTYTRQWSRQKAYGGLLVENLTQAVARDVLADALLRVDEWGYDIVLHVHDEIVVEMQPEQDFKALEQLVAEVPIWAKGLPISAEGWLGHRYRK